MYCVKSTTFRNESQYLEADILDIRKTMKNKLPEKTIQEATELINYFNDVDPYTDTILKAHLKIESVIDSIIKEFIFNSIFIDEAKITFFQKVKIAQSMSLDNYNDPLWEVILLLNNMRNSAVHKIQNTKRDEQLVKLKLLIKNEIKGNWEEMDDIYKITFTTALIIGFLNAFQREVVRFKEVINGMDKIMNPHRHT